MTHRSPRLFTSSRLLPLLLSLGFTSNALPEDLSTSSGAQLFKRYCASCHGGTAEGNGPVAPFFKLAPPDLTLIAKRSGGTFPAEKVLRIVDGRESVSPHGSREMPVWGLEFAMTQPDAQTGRAAADTSIMRLVEYLRSLQKK